MGKRSDSSATRAELNRQIRTAVKRFDISGSDDEDTWAFLCECGADGCQEWVTMRVDAYETLHQSDEPILAPGHHGQPRREGAPQGQAAGRRRAGPAGAGAAAGQARAQELLGELT